MGIAYCLGPHENDFSFNVQFKSEDFSEFTTDKVILESSEVITDNITSKHRLIIPILTQKIFNFFMDEVHKSDLQCNIEYLENSGFIINIDITKQKIEIEENKDLKLIIVNSGSDSKVFTVNVDKLNSGFLPIYLQIIIYVSAILVVAVIIFVIVIIVKKYKKRTPALVPPKPQINVYNQIQPESKRKLESNIETVQTIRSQRNFKYPKIASKNEIQQNNQNKSLNKTKVQNNPSIQNFERNKPLDEIKEYSTRIHMNPKSKKGKKQS